MFIYSEFQSFHALFEILWFFLHPPISLGFLSIFAFHIKTASFSNLLTLSLFIIIKKKLFFFQVWHWNLLSLLQTFDYLLTSDFSSLFTLEPTNCVHVTSPSTAMIPSILQILLLLLLLHHLMVATLNFLVIIKVNKANSTIFLASTLNSWCMTIFFFVIVSFVFSKEVSLHHSPTKGVRCFFTSLFSLLSTRK